MIIRLLQKLGRVWKKAFKSCTFCQALWPTRDDFVDDPDLKPTGYMANFDRLELGIFLFDHLPCRTTLALAADKFRDLYDGPVYTEPKTGSDECPGYCFDKDELRPCPVECECAYIREVLNVIASRKMQGPETSSGPNPPG